MKNSCRIASFVVCSTLIVLLLVLAACGNNATLTPVPAPGDAAATNMAQTIQAGAHAIETENARIIVEWTATARTSLPTATPTRLVIDATTTSNPPTVTIEPTTINAPSESPTIFYVVVTSIPTNTRVPVPTVPRPTAAPATKAGTSSQADSFGEGIKIVGNEIKAGTYRSMGGSACYWERLSGFGGTLDEILANENANGPTVVTIAPTDKGFDSSGCGVWTQDLTPIRSNPTATFGNGTFIVNKDVAPGTWRSSGSDSCYWARLTGFSGELEDIIANDNVTGPAIVAIGAGDIGFVSSDCGTWTKIQ